MKILFILPDFNSGGSQKYILNLCSLLDINDFQIYIYVPRFTGKFIDDIPHNVKILNTRNRSYLGSLFLLVFHLLHKSPDITFSVLNRTNILNILSSILSFKRNKIIIRESNSPLDQYKFRSIPRSTLALSKILYRFSDSIIAQTHEMKEDMIKFYSIDGSKIQVLHNPINTENIDLKIRNKYKLLDTNKTNIIAVGRIEYQKGYDLLIKSFAIALKKNSQLHLNIIGENNTTYFPEIKQLIDDLDLTNNISFLGYQSNPYQFFQQSDVFIMTSYYEGLPNALIEARYIGVPVVVTNTLQYYSTIIDSGDGFIVNFDVDEICDALLDAVHLKPRILSIDYQSEYLTFLNNVKTNNLYS